MQEGYITTITDEKEGLFGDNESKIDKLMDKISKCEKKQIELNDDFKISADKTADICYDILNKVPYST